MLDANLFSDWRRHDDFTREAFHQQITKDSLHPIGDRAVRTDNIDVFYFCSADEPIDPAWYFGLFPSDVAKLDKLLTRAFSQWRTHVPDEETIEWLTLFSDEKRGYPEAYPIDSVSVFESRGYTPFFHITAIHFCEDSKCVIITGRTDIVPHLDEHGISIELSNHGVKFGERIEFLEQFNDSE